MRKKSFTFIEVLMIFAVLAIIVALFIPLLKEAKEKQENPILQVEWQTMQDYRGKPYIHRTKVLGGWLVDSRANVLVFVRDPQHNWCLLPLKVEKD